MITSQNTGFKKYDQEPVTRKSEIVELPPVLKHFATYASVIWQGMKKANKRGFSYTWYDALRLGAEIRRQLKSGDWDEWYNDKVGAFVLIKTYSFFVFVNVEELEVIEAVYDNPRLSPCWENDRLKKIAEERGYTPPAPVKKTPAQIEEGNKLLVAAMIKASEEYNLGD